MKIMYVSVIVTGIVVALAIAMVAPAFTQMRHQTPHLETMLSFSIIDDENIEWCDALSSVLQKHNVKATVFITGKVAEQHPECVASLADNTKIDIGSQTYNYVELHSITDYSVQLAEVRNGKEAVDEAGKIYSRLFKAPYGSTDENIYSLLSRSDIIADFSYDDQYNKYYDGKFIWFNISVYDGAQHEPNFFYSIPITEAPVLIHLDNYTPIDEIDNFITDLKSGNIRFVNASDVTGLDLTIREGQTIL